MIKTMQQATIEFLDDKKKATLEDILEHVAKELKDSWEKAYSQDAQIVKKSKVGELYTMLSVNGNFILTEDKMWTLTKFYSFEEIQKMRLNISDLED